MLLSRYRWRIRKISMQSGIGNTGVWYSAGITVQANIVFLPNKYACLGWTHLPASNLLQCLVIWFPCLTLYFLSLVSLVLVIRLYLSLMLKAKKIHVFDSSANSLIRSFLNFPITIKECKNCYFAIDFFSLKLHFTFWFCPSDFFPVLSCFSLSPTCVHGPLLSWSCRPLKSLWCSLFPWWFSLLLWRKCHSMMELWSLLNSFFFPSSYLWQDPGHQFIYPTPFL